MTRDELIKKVANIIAITCGNDYAYECAIDVIDTIFDASREPTEEMWENKVKELETELAQIKAQNREGT